MQTLQILILEDVVKDTELMVYELRKSGLEFNWQRVATSAEFRSALSSNPNVILADYTLPQFDALSALQVLHEQQRDIPFIVVTGTVGEEAAVECMKKGAADYLLKDRLARLGPAVQRVLYEQQLRVEKMQAEEALRQSQKMESLGLLAGGVAHDFNNLLVAILGHNALALAHLTENHSAYKAVTKAINAARRAADITQQLLAYLGHTQLDFKPISLNALIDENIQLFEIAVPEHIQLIPQLTEPLPAIDADIGQIQQIIMNLIINAVQAIDQLTGTIIIHTREQIVTEDDRAKWLYTGDPVSPGHYILLEVRDDGAGMDPNTRMRIFDPFFSTKSTGRGLGLPVVLGIISGHGGGIRVLSKVGEGTTFQILFPVSNDLPTTVEFDQFGKITSEVTEGTLLIIDDDPVVREALEDILALEELNVMTASSGEAGIAVYKEKMNSIQLVLLDLSMPGLGGEQTLLELRKINPDVKVIVSSGYGQADVTRRFSRIERVQFLPKPYEVHDLLNAIGQLLQVP